MISVIGLNPVLTTVSKQKTIQYHASPALVKEPAPPAIIAPAGEIFPQSRDPMTSPLSSSWRCKERGRNQIETTNWPSWVRTGFIIWAKISTDISGDLFQPLGPDWFGDVRTFDATVHGLSEKLRTTEPSNWIVRRRGSRLLLSRKPRID